MQVRIALKTIFTKAERFLLRNNKAFVLQSESSSSDSTDDGKKDLVIAQELIDKDKRNSPYFTALLKGTLKQRELQENEEENMSLLFNEIENTERSQRIKVK